MKEYKYGIQCLNCGTIYNGLMPPINCRKCMAPLIKSLSLDAMSIRLTNQAKPIMYKKIWFGKVKTKPYNEGYNI